MKFEDMNIDNTHPAELKRESFNKIDGEINYYRRKVKFSIVSLIFFFLIAVMIVVNYDILSPYFAIIPLIISVIFGFQANKNNEEFKFEKLFRRVLELYLEENGF